MNSIVYNIALVTHIVGITIMAGATFIDYVTFKAFCKAFPADKTKSNLLEDLLYKLQRFLGIGLLIILLSGVAMMIYLHQVWGQQVWFRIKIGILLLIIINGLAFRRRLGKSLNVLTGEPLHSEIRFTSMRKKMTAVQLLQLLFFIIIFTLSVFKFN